MIDHDDDAIAEEMPQLAILRVITRTLWPSLAKPAHKKSVYLTDPEGNGVERKGLVAA
jgi:hypothetical protein